MLKGLRTMTWLRRCAEAGLLAGLFGCLVVYAGLKIAMIQVAPLDLSRIASVSPIVVDRNERLLRAFTTPDDRWRLPVALKDVTPKYIDILLAYEDRRFYAHHGVDFAALLRATWQAMTNGRIVSGGSTLTMQVARLISGHHARDVPGKLKQMVQALQLEQRLTKAEILDLYLRLAPFGGNLEGVRAASLAYFGKEPRRLSLGEAALLVALPQSPEARRPDRHAARARRARDKVLLRAKTFGVLSLAATQRALLEDVPRRRRAFPMHAPHLADVERTRAPKQAIHRTTLDRSAQALLQSLVLEQTRMLGDKLSAALLAIDNATGDVISYVGSPDYLADKRHGAIDMVQAIRSPGSTLKPFIYGMAFEAGLGHPETLIEDRRVRFGHYSPENFDDDFHGTVTLREALGQSLNIPAVKLLHAVGPLALIDRFRKFDVTAELPDQARPSLAVALGGVGMRMLDLGKLYTGLARGGSLVDLKWRRDKDVSGATTLSANQRGGRTNVLSDVAAWYVTDILKDAPVPAHTKAGRIAYKTGTSYGYRDAWAAGYDGRHTIIVWVGRPDAVSTPGLIGRTAAAPILFSAFERLAGDRSPLQSPPSGAVRVKGPDLPPPLKRFRGDAVASAASVYRDEGLAIAFPRDRTELDMSGRDGEPLVLKAAGGMLPLTWLVDGVPVDAPHHQRSMTWVPKNKGFVNFSVIDAKGQVDRVHVRLQ
jgi:penicillin-binding protein 1C